MKQTTLRLPLQATDLGEIFDDDDHLLADVFFDSGEGLANCAEKAKEIVRRLNLHDELVAALRGVLAIVDDSRGVDGYHLNGDVAEWDSFPEIGAAVAILAKVDQKEGR